jgi:agmatinase
MIRRLRDEGYVDVDGRSLSLTGKGRSLAESVVRKHRLAERLLTDIIGLPWDKAHLEAGRWEHVISDEVEALLVERLGRPTTCPHGNPIPGSGGQPALDTVVLSSVPAGQHVRLERVTEQVEIDSESLSYLSSHGFVPGKEATVSSRAPDGTLTLDLGFDGARAVPGLAAVRNCGMSGPDHHEPPTGDPAGRFGERIGNMYGPDATFVGVPKATLDEQGTWETAGAVIIGAPFDGGTSHRPGARFGPQAIRLTDYLPHDGSRPHLALGVDPLIDLAVVDVGDVLMPPGVIDESLRRLEDAVALVASSGALPVILGGDHTIAWPDVTGVARHHGYGRVSVIHFDAHADTGDLQFGHLAGHGTPMRRLIDSGAARGDRFLQIGLRGYWPEPPTLEWMAGQGMRSFEMAEIVSRGLEDCLTEAMSIATDDCDAVFLSVDVDVVDPGLAPGTGTPEPGGLTSRQLLDAVRRIAMEVPLAGMDVVEVAPPYDSAEVTAYLGNRVVLEALSGVAWRRTHTAGAAGQGAPDPAWPLLDPRRRG